jgi:long-chain acyl-CoA synthetase
MLGYYKDEQATKEIMTEDGFLRTGDLAEFDSDGFLRITGRKKEIIVTAGGKNIAPLNIEKSLLASRFIEQVAVIGEKKKYLSALVVPSFAELDAWAKTNGVDAADREALVENVAVKKLFEEEIAKLTCDLGQVEQIKKFTLLPAEWSMRQRAHAPLTGSAGSSTRSTRPHRSMNPPEYSVEEETGPCPPPFELSRRTYLP